MKCPAGTNQQIERFIVIRDLEKHFEEAGDGQNNMVAFDGSNGDLLWHTRIGNMTNPPQTYMVDGRQYLLVAVRDRLFSFVRY